MLGDSPDLFSALYSLATTGPQLDKLVPRCVRCESIDYSEEIVGVG